VPLADTHSSLHNACTVSPTLTRIGACASLLDHSRHTQSCLVGRVLPHVRADAQEASGFVLMRAFGFPWNQIWFFSPKHSPFTPSQRRKEAEISPLVKAYCRGQCSRSTSPFRPRSRRLARHRAGMSLRDARPLRAGTYPLDERSSHRIFRCAHAARRSRRRATSRALPIVWVGGA
jgi:hypothetical protein